jgi:hypothetical protein
MHTSNIGFTVERSTRPAYRFPLCTTSPDPGLTASTRAIVVPSLRHFIQRHQGLTSPPGHVLPSAHGATPKGPDPRVQRMTINLLKRFTE